MTHPLLYQVNTRALLSDRAAVLGRPATLDDITDEDLDAIARIGVRLGLDAGRVADR